jgi:hypothetical protein
LLFRDKTCEKAKQSVPLAAGKICWSLLIFALCLLSSVIRLLSSDLCPQSFKVPQAGNFIKKSEARFLDKLYMIFPCLPEFPVVSVSKSFAPFAPLR